MAIAPWKSTKLYCQGSCHVTHYPYANEADSLQLAELTIENRLDQVSLYGSIALTRDKVGLQHARQLKAIVDAVVAALEADQHLPEHIAVQPTDQVDNPFK